MIWLLLGVLLIGAVALLFRKPQSGATGIDSVGHFKAQLGELEADQARGLIDDKDAAAAKVEIERRLLRRSKEGGALAVTDGGVRAVIPYAVFVLLMSAAIYFVMGRPDLPAKPGFIANNRQMLVEEGGPTYGEALRAIESHLEDAPDDVRGWDVLAKSARAIRDYSLAANAFAELARLEPKEPKWRVQQLEAMMGMADGQITPAARLVLARLMSDEPNHPAGQYYMGLAYFQAGDEDKARAVWLALADRSPADAPWMAPLRERLTALGEKLPSISDEEMAAVAAMSDEDREAFIKQMIERLAARLEANPGDVDGWMMLARSQLSMGDRESAIAALERGIALVDEADKPTLKAFLDNVRANPDL